MLLLDAAELLVLDMDFKDDRAAIYNVPYCPESNSTEFQKAEPYIVSDEVSGSS